MFPDYSHIFFQVSRMFRSICFSFVVNDCQSEKCWSLLHVMFSCYDLRRIW